MEDANLDVKEATSESQEIKLDKSKTLVSITDKSGKIEYCSDEFVELSGFDTVSLIGHQHNIMRHEDMPKTLYKYIWNRLENEEELSAVIKNYNKNGDFYWSRIDFLMRRDDDGNVIGYRANRTSASKKAIDTLIPLYERLIYLEENTDSDLAMNFFLGYFSRRDTDYDGFIEKLINPFNNSATLIAAKKSRFSKIRSILKKK